MSKPFRPEPDRDLYSGLIRLRVLHHAAEEPIFGLDMAEELERHGYHISPGTLYPLLHGLESKGYLRGSASSTASRGAHCIGLLRWGERRWQPSATRSASCLLSSSNPDCETDTRTRALQGRSRARSLCLGQKRSLAPGLVRRRAPSNANGRTQTRTPTPAVI